MPSIRTVPARVRGQIPTGREQEVFRKNFQRSFFPALLISLLGLGSSDAGIGGDNPTGPTGEYNGSITTAGSYDPFTGNAKRFVDDCTVTGSIGAYPLKWTRVLNTRNPSPWSHSYQWGLSVVP